jgi:hypothetical protein
MLQTAYIRGIEAGLSKFAMSPLQAHAALAAMGAVPGGILGAIRSRDGHRLEDIGLGAAGGSVGTLLGGRAGGHIRPTIGGVGTGALLGSLGGSVLGGNITQ